MFPPRDNVDGRRIQRFRPTSARSTLLPREARRRTALIPVSCSPLSVRRKQRPRPRPRPRPAPCLACSEWPTFIATTTSQLPLLPILQARLPLRFAQNVRSQQPAVCSVIVDVDVLSDPSGDGAALLIGRSSNVEDLSQVDNESQPGVHVSASAESLRWMAYIHEEFATVKAHRPSAVRGILGHVRRPGSPIFIEQKLHRFDEYRLELIGGREGRGVQKAPEVNGCG